MLVINKKIGKENGFYYNLQEAVMSYKWWIRND